ncbi:HNH endonuclease signature motif containing protein [Arthrobacter sp. MA-N2]|uniref:HNH endonuclease signature motif containing protein n=1 Tax=Arthrobacter sp. MA-N2 TaxID=1101188 RepID=UPI0012DF0813|nr:HNH endonuclease [Arthrobacter sp. MA-N2]
MAAYGLPWSEAGHYELDHLVPLADGGASDVRNLWPEPNTFVSGIASKSAFIQNDKDQVEASLFDALCSGRTDLARSQRVMASDWSTAAEVLGLLDSHK